MPPIGGDVDIHLIFSGKRELFVASKHLNERLDISNCNIIGIDINRRGKYSVIRDLPLSEINRIKYPSDMEI